MGDVVVRQARHEDLDTLVGLIRSHVKDSYERPEPPAENVRSLLGTLLFGKEGVVLLAEESGRPTGFAILYFTYSTEHAEKIAVLNDVHVIQGERGSGVGGELFEACRAFTKENGFAYLTWQVPQDNTKAQEFFEKMGATREDWVTYSI